MDRVDDTQPLDLPRPAPTPRTAFDGYPDHLRPDPVRRKVVDRLTLVGRRHARHLADLHATPTRPGPHVVVFLYRQPTTGADQVRTNDVRIASRMFLDGPDVADLPTVLTTLHQRAREYLATGRFDPRRHMSDRAEPMTAASTYLGVATSTLIPPLPGTPDTSWQGLASLHDGTRLALRSRSATLHPMTITSTHTLDTGSLAPEVPYPWRWASREQRGPELGRACDALDQLHLLLTDTNAHHAASRR
ncbi:hypothetical protein [Pseudonocardia lacus]|uniref:hypothetical protein n=1 Tax=Pseudonocardia lacus TaxID=2835865 RepID=UPI001BDCAA86|nr:hypothetical protein [Pseudonocardia lacus]